jgi:hypothetical protein
MAMGRFRAVDFAALARYYQPDCIQFILSGKTQDSGGGL